MNMSRKAGLMDAAPSVHARWKSALFCWNACSLRWTANFWVVLKNCNDTPMLTWFLEVSSWPRRLSCLLVCSCNSTVWKHILPKNYCSINNLHTFHLFYLVIIINIGLQASHLFRFIYKYVSMRDINDHTGENIVGLPTVHDDRK